ncbi:MAG TPA: radical SAM family heme chaperone HemW [Pyrinomonadaceae bacterium]|nr:radical SAM family heme chaperone HemW [Pyrinomonadaceae bacterium]
MPAGIYIHTPFCRSRCSYCDFATGMYESAAAERYVRALTDEISDWHEVTAPETVDTIYLGGGTPSLLSIDQLGSLLDAVRNRFQVTDHAEVTLEINPGDGGIDHEARLERIGAWRRLGINRASFGAQTFNDRELKLLGRTHDADDISQTFELLREAGFDNINFDLIAGLPGQTLAGWKRNLSRALDLRPEHLSLYLLDVHEGTPLYDQIARGMRPQPDEDLAAEMYAVMIEEVCAAGYQHYEISNFSLPGFASRHNTKYWTRDAYYGFGNSAHSHDGAHRRWANERDPAKYVELTDRGDSAIVERTELTAEDARSEAIFLGLRLMRGIDLGAYRTRFGSDLRGQFNGELDRLSEAGLIEIDADLLRLTSRGALLSNEVFAALG